ncbi:MAG TPA: T9SS type A sorting domain-containing protein [Candidatus Edwardsbacteria bacterium]|nr:T9SS type A sorting domain-containing protein [Candidatus Edwardsbacteria bacterium]
MRIFLIIAAAIVVTGTAMAQDLFPLGGKVHDPRLSYPAKCSGHPPVTASSLPKSVDHSGDMPPVGTQSGSSCTGWSVGYYFKTHQERVERGWDLSDPGHQASPMFLYNQLNEGVDGGADLFDALELMWAHGCAPISQMAANCSYTLWPGETAFDSALLYRCDQDGAPYFHFGDGDGVAYAKQLLDANECVVFNISVFHNFDYINSYDTCYCGADSSGANRGGHNQCIVGYDDNKATHDGTGAFRCVNSWGTSWGNKGYYWLSYQIVTGHPGMVYPWAGTAPDRIGYQPTLKVRVRVSHAKRGRVEFIAGVGPAGAPLWSKTFYAVGSGLGQYWGTGGDLAFPATNIVLDLSEGAPYLDSTASNNVFVGCVDRLSDGTTGSIAYLAAEYLPWGASAVSVETPKAIPDYNAYVYCNVALAKPSGVSAAAGGAAPARGPALAIYPNPARQRCVIALNSSAAAGTRITIYDAAGRLVQSLAAAGSGCNWDLRDDRGRRIAPGVYFIRTSSAAARTGKLVVVD